MRPWTKPSHRDNTKPQIEFCELCGAMVAADDRILATTEGMAGRWVCKEHYEMATTPSYNDYGGPGSAAPKSTRETLPHSGSNWVNDDSDW